MEGVRLNKRNWQRLIVLQIILVVSFAATMMIFIGVRDQYTIHSEESSSPLIYMTYDLDGGHDYWIDIEVSTREPGTATVTANVAIYYNNTAFGNVHLADIEHANGDAVARDLARIHVYIIGDTALTLNGTLNGDSWTIKVLQDVPPYLNVGINVALLSFLGASLSLIYTLYKYYTKFVDKQSDPSDVSESENN